MSGGEVFQVVGGALATVDLALKLYKEITRFRIRVRHADEAGREMSEKIRGLTTTLGDVHSALKCRQDQVEKSGRQPDEGEARVYKNIRRSLVGMTLSLRKFNRELEILDNGRDIDAKRKWIDRAIWQLKLDKTQPLFRRLEDAANDRRKELSLSVAALQVFMHSESTQFLERLEQRIAGIEELFHKASISSLEPRRTTITRQVPRTPRISKTSEQLRLQKCLRAAHAIVNERRQAGRNDSVMQPRHPSQDSESLWEETDSESIFSRRGSERRPTIHVPPDVQVNENVISDNDDDEDEDDLPSDDQSILDMPASFFGPGDASSDEDDDDDDYFSQTTEFSTTSSTTDITNAHGHANDSMSDLHDRFFTAQNSLGTQTSQGDGRTFSVASTNSSVSFGGVDGQTASQLIKAVKEKDAKFVERILRGRIPSTMSIPEHSEAPPSPRPPPSPQQTYITVSKLPVVHYALKIDAGADVVQSLTYTQHQCIDINAREPEEHKTALHYAVKFNRDACCTHILASPGVNIEARDKYDQTPLTYALSLSSDEADMYAVTKILLDKGASLPETLPRGMSKNVDDLVRRHQKRQKSSSSSSGRRRRESSGSMNSKLSVNSATSASLRKSRSTGQGMNTPEAPERRDSESSVRKRGLSLLHRSSSAR